MRRAALCGTLNPTKSTRENSTRKELPEYFKDVSPRKKGDNSWLKFMLVSMVTKGVLD